MLLNVTDCHFFMIFKWRRLSLFGILRISGFRERRKNPILTKTLSTTSLVMFEGTEKLVDVWIIVTFIFNQIVFFFQ